jgi:hypothetical protein
MYLKSGMGVSPMSREGILPSPFRAKTRGETPLGRMGKMPMPLNQRLQRAT